MDQHDDLERQRRIEAYVHGRLSGEERAVFEHSMASDAGLREAVDLERTMHDVLRHEERLRFQDVVSQASDELDAEEMAGAAEEAATGTPVIPITRKRNRVWLAAAASVALVAGAIGIWRMTERPDYDQLAMNAVRYYEFSTTRGGGGASAGLERTDHALTALIRSGKLDEYLEESAAVLDSDSAFAARFGPDVHRDRAKVFLGLKRTTLAIHEADVLRKSPDPAGACDADAIEGLAYALDGKRELASRKLEAANNKGCLDEIAKPLIRE